MSQHDATVMHTRMFLENMVSLAMKAQEAGIDITPQQMVGPTLQKIVELASQHFPLSKVLDESDLVFHAEGPGAANSMPWLGALNWITSTADSNIRKLALAFFDMKGGDGKAILRKFEPRLTGIAPGSLWVGIAIPSTQDFSISPEHLDGPTLRDEVHQLPELVQFIGDEGMREGIEEISPDPAMRDISLTALMKFSPTGRKGIHTLDISSRIDGVAKLGQRERVVLREAIDKPNMRKAVAGSFVGEIREADLDKTRLHLRGVKHIGTLRCVVPSLNVEQAKTLLGKYVRAVGSYQVDRSGRPRLLFVERFEDPGLGGPTKNLDF